MLFHGSIISCRSKYILRPYRAHKSTYSPNVKKNATKKTWLVRKKCHYDSVVLATLIINFPILNCSLKFILIKKLQEFVKEIETLLKYCHFCCDIIFEEFKALFKRKLQ